MERKKVDGGCNSTSHHTSDHLAAAPALPNINIVSFTRAAPSYATGAKNVHEIPAPPKPPPIEPHPPADVPKPSDFSVSSDSCDVTRTPVPPSLPPSLPPPPPPPPGPPPPGGIYSSAEVSGTGAPQTIDASGYRGRAKRNAKPPPPLVPPTFAVSESGVNSKQPALTAEESIVDGFFSTEYIDRWELRDDNIAQCSKDIRFTLTRLQQADPFHLLIIMGPTYEREFK